jgi:CHAT domain-containing protein
MVSQPNTPGMGKIPFARDEVEKIKKELGVRGIPSCTLEGEKATVGHVLESMEKFACIHLACHASQHAETPLKSSIHLHDGPLELSEIMKKNLRNCDFAFLSACQTSKGDAKLPDEVVHLASGMLAAGYRNVVGTMWSVLDEHGPDLAEFFYKRLLEDTTNGGGGIDGRRAARALHDATKHLREKISDLPYSFLAWVPYIHIGDLSKLEFTLKLIIDDLRKLLLDFLQNFAKRINPISFRPFLRGKKKRHTAI